jgi:hypothetical protein
MSFLAPWLLYGLAALAAPVVIHLWQRKRVIKVPFSTLRFLKIVAARTSRSAKLENLLLLLLRCLVSALLILAAARPVASTDATRLFGGNVPRTIALVIDHSLSMSYQSGEETRLARAKRQAHAVIDDLKPGDATAVIAVNDRAQLLIAEPTVDHAVARQSIDAIQPSELRTDLGAGLREARKAVAKALRGSKQVFLFTDNQESAWQFERAAVFDEAWKMAGAKLVIVTPDDLSALNAAVTKVRFDSPFAASGAMLRGAVTIENHSAAPLRDLVEIKLGGERVAQRPVEAAPGSSVEVSFEIQTPTILGRWAQGSASLTGDNLAGDDRRFFTLPVFQPPRVLIVEAGSGPERARAGFFLRKALAAGAASAPVKTIGAAELDELPIDAFSAVFLASVPNLSDRAAVRLDRYLESAGTVVIFPSDEMDIAAVARLEFLPAKPERILDLPAGRLPARAIEPQHPLFTNSWDANTPFPALPQRRLMQWKLNANGRVLLSLGDNLPFIISGERGTGRAIIVNASADRAWGDFPLTSAFLPLVQQIGRLAVARTGRDAEILVGEPLPAPLSLPRDQALLVKNPRGDSLPVAPGAPLIERAESAGHYEVSSATEGVLHQFAVNIDSRESTLGAISADALGAIVPHERIVGLDALRLWLAQSRGLVPLWPLLLVLAAIVFAGESVYSNLLAARRAQGEADHIKTGRLNKRRIGRPFRGVET